VAPRSRSGSRPGRALAVLAALILVMLISITGSKTFSPGNWHKQFKVGLGLDLSSGTEIVLKAAKGTPSAGAMAGSIGVLLQRVNGTGNSGAQVQQQGSDQVTITVPGQAATSVINEVTTVAKLSFRPVLYQSLSGAAISTTVKPSATPSASSSATPSASSSATPTSSATPKASATTSASPKASTAAVAERLASPTASPTPTTSAKSSATPKASATAPATPSPTASAATVTGYGDASAVQAPIMKLFDKMVCKPGPNANTVNESWKATVGYTAATSQWDDLKNQIVSCDANGYKYVLGPAVVDGTQVTAVNASLDSTNEQWVVNITLNSAAAGSFGTLTTNQYSKYYAQAYAAEQQGGFVDDSALDETAIVLDGNVQEAPLTEGALTSGQFQISGPSTSGGFTQAQATQLTNILKYGSLPVSFVPSTISSISPQVGHASLDAGLLAGAIGLLLVVLYLFYYYRGLGIVSVSSLLLAALLAYLSVVILSRYQNFNMSLSAIAGLVVAIGITADSFIVYFERLRDEVRDGKTLRPAVEAGWKRARRTILVSDTVSFLAAVLLYHFAVSDVQGFAYTLGLTTIIDVVVVFLFTKPMVTVLAGTKFFSSGHKWSGLDPQRLGAKAPWRGAGGGTIRRTVRTHRTGPVRSMKDAGSADPSKEA
jgi:preprotein translocase subunit SecD